MDSDYYGLRQQPFQMRPDARLFYASSVHRRGFAHLAYGLAQREGFIVITGEIGAGKTTLIDRMCGELDQSLVVARLATTQLSGDDMLRMVADGFGAEPEGNKAAVLRGITAVLRRPGPRHLLIVDEAQGLSFGALEELRMLSNLTLPGQPPLQTILLGQPQLGRLLASPELEQLRQRVLASYHLVGLTAAETGAYVMHRLRGAGWQGRPAWDEAALAAVHRFTGGIPRRINRLCTRVMLSGALEEAETISAAMVEVTAMELEEDLAGPSPASLPALPAVSAHSTATPSWMTRPQPEPAVLETAMAASEGSAGMASMPAPIAAAPSPAVPSPAVPNRVPPETSTVAAGKRRGWFSQLFSGSSGARPR